MATRETNAAKDAARDAIRASSALPSRACDCHTHVFLDPREFPWSPQRRYTPPPATIEDLLRFHAALGIERVVIVQPSVYGSDNAATVHALEVLGKGRARGVAVIDDDPPDAALDRLDAAGVRGVRVNLEIDREGDAAKATAHMRRIAERIAPRGWHMQLYANLPLIARCVEAIDALPVPVVFDHYAGAHARAGADLAGLDAVLGLVERGKAYVKLSAPYRCSDQDGYGDLDALTRRFVARHADRMLWGSDWPHPRPEGLPVEAISPPFEVDSAHVLVQLRRWLDDDALFTKLLVDNPERLYGFDH